MGVVMGWLYTRLEERVDLRRINQWFYGNLSLGLIILAWLVALQ